MLGPGGAPLRARIRRGEQAQSRLWPVEGRTTGPDLLLSRPCSSRCTSGRGGGREKSRDRDSERSQPRRAETEEGSSASHQEHPIVPRFCERRECQTPVTQQRELLSVLPPTAPHSPLRATGEAGPWLPPPSMSTLIRLLSKRGAPRAKPLQTGVGFPGQPSPRGPGTKRTDTAAEKEPLEPHAALDSLFPSTPPTADWDIRDGTARGPARSLAQRGWKAGGGGRRWSDEVETERALSLSLVPRSLHTSGPKGSGA